MATKVDFKKILKPIYNPQKVGFHFVDVPQLQFLMLDGTGNPNTSSDYQAAIETLYALSYGIKFALKPRGYEYSVPPLEGLWWMDDMNEFTMENKPRWKWTMMIMQPEWVKHELVEKVQAEIKKKKDLPKLLSVRFEQHIEGLAVQILYTGPYDQEAPTIAEMHRFIESNGYHTNGKHHEIYLSDVRKTAAVKLKTILRQPISNKK
jgi:hypothetical protein